MFPLNPHEVSLNNTASSSLNPKSSLPVGHPAFSTAPQTYPRQQSWGRKPGLGWRESGRVGLGLSTTGSKAYVFNWQIEGHFPLVNRPAPVMQMKWKICSVTPVGVAFPCFKIHKS